MKNRWLAVPGLFLFFVIRSPGLSRKPASAGARGTRFEGARKVDASDVAVPAGYQLRAVATGLTFPTGITFDSDGAIYVVESGYAYGEVWTKPRLLRIESTGRFREIAAGQKNGPWTGVSFHDGNFYVAEGGELEGGRILKITANGAVS